MAGIWFKQAGMFSDFQDQYKCHIANYSQIDKDIGLVESYELEKVYD